LRRRPSLRELLRRSTVEGDGAMLRDEVEISIAIARSIDAVKQIATAGTRRT
jgi:hypothetical protein